MNQYICIHGHFYQPPRDNPWLESVERQDSAHPFHDWNERIASECYAPNALSRILDHEGQIVNIVNNYEKISFDFGPTLLSWLELKMPEIYVRILEADQNSQKRFGGHGSAIAQAYNHLIMPLANRRDKQTQVLWGIEDFKHRFGRMPEGMWLPETAVGYDTLEIMAEYGIKFTILSQKQCARVRKIGEEEWHETQEGSVDPRRAYRINLSEGRSIAIFFYAFEASHAVAFGGLLQNGEILKERLLNIFSSDSNTPELANICCDGETFGHHQHHGDMALAYALQEIESNQNVRITVYGEYLELHPPLYEVDVYEASSWSCIHGIERWRNDCGCCSGKHTQWHQRWRKPLRDALDWLRDELIIQCERGSEEVLKDLWSARDAYIRVILNRNEDEVGAFLAQHASKELDEQERVRLLKLMEIERHAMLMFTSCGWFFDEISGLETQQILSYAAYAMQLARELFNIDFEPAFMNLLADAPSNLAQFENGKKLYAKLVSPSHVDNARYAACYAVALLYKAPLVNLQVYAYDVEVVENREGEWARFKYLHGALKITSRLTQESNRYRFVAADLGEQNILAVVTKEEEGIPFDELHEQIEELMSSNNGALIIETLKADFANSYSLWDMVRDVQRSVLEPILSDRMWGPEAMYRQVYQNSYSTLQLVRDLNAPPPPILTMTVEYVLNQELLAQLEHKNIDAQQWSRNIDELASWGLRADANILSFRATKRLNMHFEQLLQNPEGYRLLRKIYEEFTLFAQVPLALNPYVMQNGYFHLAHTIYPDMKQQITVGGRRGAQEWVHAFEQIQPYLGVRLP